MAAPRNRGLWTNGKPIAPGSRIPVSREALADQQSKDRPVLPVKQVRPMVRPMFQVKKDI